MFVLNLFSKIMQNVEPQLAEREREITFNPHIVLCVPVLLPPSCSPPLPHFSSQRLIFLSALYLAGPLPHVGISYSDHFQLMSSFISGEQSKSGRRRADDLILKHFSFSVLYKLHKPSVDLKFFNMFECYGAAC